MDSGFNEIPFVDLKGQYLEIRDDIQAAINDVFNSSRFILDKNVDDFENKFASYIGSNYAIAVGSGTDALQLSLVACEIGPGDEVITAPNTALPTVAAITCSGATPVFVDIDPETYTIDANRIETKITSRTKAVVPVHLYGQMADIETVKNIAAEYSLYVIEDACQAHGARVGSKKAGSFGDLGCFSFYPTKNLGGYGDSGMVVTDDASLATRIGLLRNYGETTRYHHMVKGFNSRMDELQAAILQIKLCKLDEYNNLRRAVAAEYNALLADVEDIILPVEKNGIHIYHLYVIRTVAREELRRFLEERKVRTQIHYPVPVHLQKAYLDLGYERGGFPITETVSKEILSLPMYPELKKNEIERVSDAIKEFFDKF